MVTTRSSLEPMGLLRTWSTCGSTFRPSLAHTQRPLRSCPTMTLELRCVRLTRISSSARLGLSEENRLQFCIISTHTHAHSHSSVHIHSLPIVNVRFGRRYLSCSSLPPLSLMVQQCFRLAAKAGSGYGCCEHHTGSAFSQCRIERQQVEVPE